MRALSSMLIRSRRARLNGESAFTLAELAVVIAILAILVSIAVPVMLSQATKAEHTVAVENLMIASKVIDNLWFNKLASQPNSISTGAYRDFDPPGEMASGATDGYVPIDAEYMSLREPKASWVDVTYGGSSGPVASLENGPYMVAEGYGFQINAVWKNGEMVDSGDDIATKWPVMAGKIGVITNQYYWEGGWNDNPDAQYITLVTLEVSKQIAHFYTLKVGVTLAGGSFDWKNGTGSPGDSFGDELASGKPPAGSTTPPDNPPVNPPGGDTTPTTPDPPPVTPPVTPPPATTPANPPGAPPGPNMASSVRIEPETLNLSSNGVFTVFIATAPGYSPNDIDPDSLKCYGAECKTVRVVGGWEVQVKFDRKDLENVPTGDHILILVTGKFNDGTVFQGWDFITVRA
jgi:prepilin-type N-terminal cleavage/methylation domain-containing protein